LVSTTEPEFLTTADVARRLQLSEETIRRWAAEGQISAIRVGRQWRIYPHVVERLLTRAVPSDASDAGVWDPARRSVLSDPEED
jgi:excisionase family DNA binding protein